MTDREGWACLFGFGGGIAAAGGLSWLMGAVAAATYFFLGLVMLASVSVGILKGWRCPL